MNESYASTPLTSCSGVGSNARIVTKTVPFGELRILPRTAGDASVNARRHQIGRWAFCVYNVCSQRFATIPLALSISRDGNEGPIRISSVPPHPGISVPKLSESLSNGPIRVNSTVPSGSQGHLCSQSSTRCSGHNLFASAQSSRFTSFFGPSGGDTFLDTDRRCFTTSAPNDVFVVVSYSISPNHRSPVFTILIVIPSGTRWASSSVGTRFTFCLPVNVPKLPNPIGTQ